MCFNCNSCNRCNSCGCGLFSFFIGGANGRRADNRTPYAHDYDDADAVNYTVSGCFNRCGQSADRTAYGWTGCGWSPCGCANAVRRRSCGCGFYNG